MMLDSNMPTLKLETEARLRKFVESKKFKTISSKTQNRLLSVLEEPSQDKSFVVKVAEGYEKFKQLPGIKQGDELVEWGAKAIEPEVPAGVSNLGLAARLPQQMAAEFVRG